MSHTERKINAIDFAPVTSPPPGGPYRISLPGKYNEDPFSTGNIYDGTPIIEGRNRVAVSVTKNRIAMAVNGGNATVLFKPPTFTMPRVAKSGKKPNTYFATEPAGTESSPNPLNQHPEVKLGGSAIWRCVWLYRKPKKDSKLKAMSVIRDLPDADDSGWARKGTGL
jgi:hypothetical protein